VNNGDETISGFSIDPSSGALTALTPALPLAPFPVSTGAGSQPFIATIDPSNKFLYVADFGSDQVSGFTIDSATGALTGMTGSPFSVGAGTGPDAVAVDPSSKYLYVANFNTETVSGFSITTGTGVLAGTPPTPLFTPVSTSPTGAPIGSGPFSMTIDPSGTFLAVPNESSNNLALLKLNAVTGAATSAGSLETRFVPEYANIYFASSAPTLAPAAVFAANSTAGTISAYTAAATTGALTATAAPVTGFAGNAVSTTDISGQFFYTTSSSSNKLLGFNATEATAALAGLSGSPYAATAPSSVVADPSGLFVYTAETGVSGQVLGFTLDKTTNSLNAIATPVAVANLKAIVEDPQGESLYGLGVNLVESIKVNQGTGVVTAGTTLTPTGTWTSGIVDPSGQYLIALDSAGKTIQVFTIGALSTFATSGAVVPTGLTNPTSLVMDPLNRFVFVADSTAKTVTAFSFNAQSGVVGSTAIASTTALSGSVGQATIDATGTYLYVAVAGTPAGSVATFKIASTGPTNITFTAVGAPVPAGDGTAGVAVSNSIK
jgi:6-phosphogluconolactonase